MRNLLVTHPPDPAREAWASDEAAQLYERARPGYAKEAVDFVVRTLAIGPGARVLDLAAGTGKLTRQLLYTGADLVAVEPLEGMRRSFSVAVPSVPVLTGRAEDLPLVDAGLEVVVAGQAWHWFDSDRALTEVSRVLVPGGGLALLWNLYDSRVEWVKEYELIRERARRQQPSYDGNQWQKAFEARADWSATNKEVFAHSVEASPEVLVDRMLTSSDILVLPETAKLMVKAEILEVLDRHAETRGRVVIAMPYRTEVFWARYRPEPTD